MLFPQGQASVFLYCRGKSQKRGFCYIFLQLFISQSLFFYISRFIMRIFVKMTKFIFLWVFCRGISLFSTVLSENSVSAVVKHSSLFFAELIDILAVFHSSPGSVGNRRIIIRNCLIRIIDAGSCGRKIGYCIIHFCIFFIFHNISLSFIRVILFSVVTRFLYKKHLRYFRKCFCFYENVRK